MGSTDTSLSSFVTSSQGIWQWTPSASDTTFNKDKKGEGLLLLKEHGMNSTIIQKKVSRKQNLLVKKENQMIKDMYGKIEDEKR